VGCVEEEVFVGVEFGVNTCWGWDSLMFEVELLDIAVVVVVVGDEMLGLVGESLQHKQVKYSLELVFCKLVGFVEVEIEVEEVVVVVVFEEDTAAELDKKVDIQKMVDCTCE